MLTCVGVRIYHKENAERREDRMAKKPRLSTDRLRGKMVEQHISHAEMARMLGIDPSTFSKKMTGKTDFTVVEALTIIRILGGGAFDEYFFIS